jgi:hypothetical protein
MEELENLEETLNDSIQESIGARAGTINRGKKKGATEDDEEYIRSFISSTTVFQTETLRLIEYYCVLIFFTCQNIWTSYEFSGHPLLYQLALLLVIII